MIFAWGNGTIDYHQSNYKLSKINIENHSVKDLSLSNHIYWNWHHWGLSSCWSIFSSIGLIFVRYFKYRNFSVLIHTIVMGMISLYTIAFALVAYIFSKIKVFFLIIFIFETLLFNSINLIR